MSIALGCIADDYTGASDLANILSKNGLRVIQTIGVPSDDLALPEADAIVVSLKSRSSAAPDAVAGARAADGWLRARGAKHVLFKICSTFDSTDAGNIGPVTDALRADTSGIVTLVTPAFPETGRTVYQGHLFVGSVPLHESPLKDHPLNPMRDSNLVRVLTRQSIHPVGLVPHGVVANGPDALAAHLDTLSTAGVTAAIVDAVSERNLETIGLVALTQHLSVGASGLGLGLARALISTGQIRGARRVPDVPEATGGAAACLVGSCSQATLVQIARAEKLMPVLRLDTEKLLAGAKEISDAVTWARGRLAVGPVLIASSGQPEQVAALHARFGREETSHAIEQAMARIAVDLVALGVRRLIVAGGETSGAVVDRLRLPGFLIGPEIAPGVPVLRTVSDNGCAMAMALKSGNFGGPNFFEDALKLML